MRCPYCGGNLTIGKSIITCAARPRCPGMYAGTETDESIHFQRQLVADLHHLGWSSLVRIDRELLTRIDIFDRQARFMLVIAELETGRKILY